MADRSYSGFCRTFERTTKRSRHRYRTFSTNSDHAVHTQDRGAIHAKAKHRTPAKTRSSLPCNPNITKKSEKYEFFNGGNYLIAIILLDSMHISQHHSLDTLSCPRDCVSVLAHNCSYSHLSGGVQRSSTIKRSHRKHSCYPYPYSLSETCHDRRTVARRCPTIVFCD